MIEILFPKSKIGIVQVNVHTEDLAADFEGYALIFVILHCYQSLLLTCDKVN